MTRINPPPNVVLPSKPFNELTRAEKLEFLQKELVRATNVVTYCDQVAAGKRQTAEKLMAGKPEFAEDEPAGAEPSEVKQTASELIAKTEMALGTDEVRLGKRILLGRAMLTDARQMQRDSRRYRWRVATTLAETLKKENG